MTHHDISDAKRSENAFDGITSTTEPVSKKIKILEEGIIDNELSNFEPMEMMNGCVEMVAEGSISVRMKDVEAADVAPSCSPVLRAHSRSPAASPVHPRSPVSIAAAAPISPRRSRSLERTVGSDGTVPAAAESKVRSRSRSRSQSPNKTDVKDEQVTEVSTNIATQKCTPSRQSVPFVLVALLIAGVSC